MDKKWVKVVIDIVKYSIGAVIGACGYSLTF